MNKIKDNLNVNMEYPASSDHVPQAEQNNRTIGKQVCTGYHRLPFSKILKVMLRYLSMILTAQLNYFPAKGGILKYYSPYMILNKQKLDYKQHCTIAFGAYVQANQDNTPLNDLQGQTLDGIYLQPLFGRNAGHEIMNLKTGAVVIQACVWEIPITKTIIRAVETLAEKQGIETLKLTGKNKIRLFHVDWGKDKEYIYDDNFEDEKNDNNYNEDEDIEHKETYKRINQDKID